MRVDARQWTSALKILLGTAAGRKKRQSARPQNQRERSNLFLFLGITAGRRAGERGHGSACNERAKQTSAIGLIWHRDSLVMCGALLYYICLQLWGIKSFSKKHALFWRFFLFSLAFFLDFEWECSQHFLVWGSRLRDRGITLLHTMGIVYLEGWAQIGLVCLKTGYFEWTKIRGIIHGSL